jgi:hypothetical protein
VYRIKKLKKKVAKVQMAVEPLREKKKKKNAKRVQRSDINIRYRRENSLGCY